MITIKINKNDFSSGVNLERFKADLVTANLKGVVESIDDKVTHIFINGEESLNNMADKKLIDATVKAHIGTPDPDSALDNMSATTDPTTSDDINAGYSVGSTWINTVLNIAFILVNPASGLWKELTNVFVLPALIQGSVLFAEADGLITEDNPNLFWDDTNNRLGIGTDSPDNPLTVNGDANIGDGFGFVVGHASKIDFGAIPEFQVLGTGTPDSSMGFARFEDNASGPDVRFLKSRGVTVGSNVIVQDGDKLGRIRFQGADSLDYNTTAGEILCEVDGTPGGNNIPGRIIFKTRTDGGSLSERMRITNSGNVAIGVDTPTAKLHVEQGLSTAAIPALRLSQSDVSEEMIEFEATIATGNPIEAVGAKTLTTTHFIKVSLPGGLTRYIPCGTIA